jgi:hypothetical protein
MNRESAEGSVGESPHPHVIAAARVSAHRGERGAVQQFAGVPPRSICLRHPVTR